MDKVDTVIRILGIEHFGRLPFVQTLSKKAKVQPNIILIAGVGLLVLLCIPVLLGTLLTTMTMFLFPAYDTFKAIESKNAAEQNRLLTYWMVFGTIFALDQTVRFVFSFLPFFHLVRFVILMVFYSKSINGADYVYQYIQKPAFQKVETVVDSIIQPVEESLAQVGEKILAATKKSE